MLADSWRRRDDRAKALPAVYKRITKIADGQAQLASAAAPADEGKAINALINELVAAVLSECGFDYEPLSETHARLQKSADQLRAKARTLKPSMGPVSDGLEEFINFAEDFYVRHSRRRSFQKFLEATLPKEVRIKAAALQKRIQRAREKRSSRRSDELTRTASTIRPNKRFGRRTPHE
jgi:hypothetical protein